MDYSGRYEVVLFKCDWVDISKGCKIDNFGMPLVNFNYYNIQGMIYVMIHLFMHLKLKKYVMWRIKHKMISLLLSMLKSEMYMIWVMSNPMT